MDTSFNVKNNNNKNISCYTVINIFTIQFIVCDASNTNIYWGYITQEGFTVIAKVDYIQAVILLFIVKSTMLKIAFILKRVGSSKR